MYTETFVQIIKFLNNFLTYMRLTYEIQLLETSIYIINWLITFNLFFMMYIFLCTLHVSIYALSCHLMPSSV